MDKNKILIALSESEHTRFGKQEFATQSIPQKVFSAIWALESEVNSGGFAHYFASIDSAETSVFVISALNTIGASQAANICTRAIDCAFPQGLPSDPELITAGAEDFQTRLSPPSASWMRHSWPIRMI